MARRSLRASAQGIQLIKKALRKKTGGQTYLAGAVNCSRQTIWSLLQGNPTDCDVFMAVCTQLGLDWNAITESEQPEPELDDRSQIDALVQAMRDRLRPLIQERCGTMRVLDMTQPIEMGSIYTDVNILERITGRRGLELAELMREVSPEEFDRFCLGDVRQNRVPGLEAVENIKKMMILGKPGAGKTTFLKHLAIQCIGGAFLADRIPMFITLKDFAEAEERTNLLGYIVFVYVDRLVSMSPVEADLTHNLSSNRFVQAENLPLQTILNAGKALILLDGLDEIREIDNDRVLRQIKEFSQQFPDNQFVITCRIAAREYTFERFTEVEIADFDDQQIADFSNKWFHCKNDPIKAERFLQKLKEDKPIRELATNPLLLTLLCLVFEDSGSFPSNRVELYEIGLDVLLKKWDVKRNIERDQVYKGLSLKRKEDLLSQIAYSTFAAGNYFFKQREVERLIRQYIQNLPNANTDPEVLEVDSAAVLKSIEAHHGLLVERARSIYSFSHLTFHEYFTAQKVFANSDPQSLEKALQTLVSHISEKRWREVFLLTVGMLPSADYLLRLMERQINILLANDEKLQAFLTWVKQKSASVNLPYKSAAIRAYYFALALALALALAFDIDRDLDLTLAHDLAFDLARALDSDHNLDLALARALTLARAHAFTHAFDLTLDLDFAFALALDPKLRQSLQQLRDQLPDTSWSNRENFWRWWQANGQAWAEQLRAVMIEHRNIGHDWQFSDDRKQLLQQYYNANLLLVDCLNSDCYVSRSTRREIEDTLLLPIAEIEKYQRDRA
jgi:predicted NACHT family NTPase